MAFLIGGGPSMGKKGPLAGPMWKVEDCPGRRLKARCGKRRLTCPLKRPGLIITSKMAVNFVVAVTT
jgi:hypothetical protein